jgi:hypothetical protein
MGSSVITHYGSSAGSVPVLRIRIRIWIHMFLGLPDLDPLVRGTGMDPDPDLSIIMQK